MRKYFWVLGSCLLTAIFYSSAPADITARLHFSHSDFDTSYFLAPDSNIYAAINCRLHNKVITDEEGSPDLPVLSYLYALPPGMEVSSVAILSVSRDLLCRISNKVAPLQPSILTRTDVGPPSFSTPSQAYTSDSWPPDSSAVICSRPVSYVRGVGIANVLVRPVQYFPARNELWQITEIIFSVQLRQASYYPKSLIRSTSATNALVTKYLKGIVQNPDEIELNSDAPMIQNNIDSDDTTISPIYLIITSDQLALHAIYLRNWKRLHGCPAEVYSLQDDIYPNYDGIDDAERLSNFLRDMYTRGALYALLLGDMDIVPVRYCYYSDVGFAPPLEDQAISDLYYADVDGNWELDGDGVWGEPNDDQPDLGADIFIGRVPVGQPADIDAWVNKLVTYLDNPGGGDGGYLNRALITSAELFADGPFSENIASAFNGLLNVDTESFRERPSGNDINPEGPFGAELQNYLSFPSAGLMISLAHGSLSNWGTLSAGDNCNGIPECLISRFTSLESEQDSRMDWGFSGNVHNQDREYVHCSVACDIGALDARLQSPDIRCFAENDLISYGGCVAGTFNTRYGWVGASYLMEENRVSLLCNDSLEHRLALAHYAVKLLLPNPRDIVYCNTYFGDPEMQVWIDQDRLRRGYMAGDANADGTLNAADVTFSINYLKGYGPTPVGKANCGKYGDIFYAFDSNGDCIVNGLDIVYTVNFLKNIGPSARICPACNLR